MDKPETKMKNRFRGYYPVVIDVETGGLDPQKHALLEVAAITLTLDDRGQIKPLETIEYKIKPHRNTRIDAEALRINNINPYDSERTDLSEAEALRELFAHIRYNIKQFECTRAILVGHNASFDLAVLNAAAERSYIKRNPFHPFSTFDTVTLAGACYGQTVLAKALDKAGIKFDKDLAHSALYDTQKTAELFCQCINMINPAPSRGPL